MTGAELASPRLGAALLDKDQPMYVPAAALVTNLAVHFKWGRENALAWVTTLDQARPVGGARVTVQNCNGATVWSGETDRDGIARIDRLPPKEDLPRCWERPTAATDEGTDFPEYHAALRSLDDGLLIIAETAADLSFVHSDWRQGIESWRFQLPEEEFRDAIVAHTVLDRPLFRAGETVHMKHLLRAPALSGFDLVPENQRPTTLSIEHQGSKDRYELPLKWDAAGVAETSWTIPASAKLGRYLAQVQLWAPRPGVHHLILVDAGRHPVDAVSFRVRGYGKYPHENGRDVR